MKLEEKAADMEVVKDKPDTGVQRHVPGDTLERYVMNRLPESELEPAEEHLLICPQCQDRLEARIEFVTAMKAAMAEFTKFTETSKADEGAPLRWVAVGARGAECVYRAKWVIRF
jgi:hypothetical protein